MNGMQEMMGISHEYIKSIPNGSAIYETEIYNSIWNFTRVLADDVTRDFVSADGEIRSSSMNALDIIDTDLGRSFAWLGLLYGIYRYAAYLVVLWVLNSHM